MTTFYSQYKQLVGGLTSDQFLDQLRDWEYCESVGRGADRCDKKVLPKPGIDTPIPKGACQMKHYRLVHPDRCDTIAEVIAYPCQIRYRLQPAAHAHGCHWVSAFRKWGKP